MKKEATTKTTRRETWSGMNWIRQDKRLAIYLRDGAACAYCGATIETGAQLSLDHIRPASQGGTNSERNLVTCCSHCNSSRGDTPVAEFATAEALNFIASTTRKSLKKFREEAKSLIARRGSAAKALA